jgi:hypothetical protein
MPKDWASVTDGTEIVLCAMWAMVEASVATSLTEILGRPPRVMEVRRMCEMAREAVSTAS